ncbi:hypothetical protein OWM54_28335 [Myxococcus sp. MISCRS1]|jgi:hypothetical protein|uniref:hypothetical protein n=1 Tax=Myxococcus TaxID=32 RepID=UPI001CBD89C4|nr:MULTISPECIES: hypothetical protein [unclassified Myxococcus]MBZ4394096.1 hypothetical protein [Myxococcus sp. AS-1-15]MBZ4409003.1 hypothetical protein [Myxococcus sp. XM-1-1-1]MCY1001065.1 hypothetical protein [Myxococcus sp. MISCRS1]BDT37377.1 hypothetical protein MFMH1_70460 [Myxococcus sp. MH1]
MNDRLVYRLDAFAAFSMGVTLLFVATPLTTLAGWTLPPSFLFGLGVFLVPWAGINVWASTQSPVATSMLLVHLLVDGTWVLGSVALMLVHSATLSTLGFVMLASQAVSVLGVFSLKLAPSLRLRLAR